MKLRAVDGIRADSIAWRDGDGDAKCTIICKVTFALKRGELEIAKVQEPVHRRPKHWDGDDDNSVYAPSDLVPYKRQPEVLVVGRAFSDGGKPVRSLIARVAVGSVDKCLEVHCDRQRGEDNEIIEGHRIRKMALRWERAAGGPHTSNPVGVEFDAPSDGLGRVPLPNLQEPGANPTECLAPVGFGPIDTRWPGRQKLSGDAGFHRRWHMTPLRDVDAAVFNAAPVDQRLDMLDGDEQLVLEHLHREEARLVCRLPGVKPRAFVQGGGAVRPVGLAPDTLWIDSDRAICALTWRGTFDVATVGEGVIHVALERPGEPLAWEQVANTDDDATVAMSDGQTATATDDLKALRDAALAALPFDRVKHAAPPPRAVRSVSPWSSGASEPRSGDTAVWEIEIGTAAAPSPAALTAPKQVVATTGTDSVVRPPNPVREMLEHRSKDAGQPSPGHESAMASPPKPREPRGDEGQTMELLWFDSDCGGAVRATFPDLFPVTDRSDEPAEDEELDPLDFAPEPAAEPDEQPEPPDPSTDLMKVMHEGQVLTVKQVRAAMRDAVGHSKRFTAPLVLLEGKLLLPFDAVERLRTTLTAVEPFAKSDKKLQERIEVVKSLLDTAWVDSSSELAERLTRELRDAVDGPLSADELAGHTDQVMTEQRKFQKRRVFDAPQIRALLRPRGGKLDVPCYLPDVLAERLPLFRELDVRLLAEAHAKQDANEAFDLALRGVVLTRLLRF